MLTASSNADRERARAVLRTFLQCAVQADDPVQELELLAPAQLLLNECGTMCRHMRNVLAECLRETDAADVLCTLLLKLYAGRPDCAASAAMFQGLLNKLARHVAANAHRLGSSNPLEGDTEARCGDKKRPG